MGYRAVGLSGRLKDSGFSDGVGSCHVRVGDHFDPGPPHQSSDLHGVRGVHPPSGAEGLAPRRVRSDNDVGPVVPPSRGSVVCLPTPTDTDSRATGPLGRCGREGVGVGVGSRTSDRLGTNQQRCVSTRHHPPQSPVWPERNGRTGGQERPTPRPSRPSHADTSDRTRPPRASRDSTPVTNVPTEGDPGL